MAYPDKNVVAVIKQFEDRMEKGYKKYGVTTEEDTTTDLLGWLQHLQEELMDAVVYIERTKQELNGQSKIELPKIPPRF
jgi:hypothetical protein